VDLITPQLQRLQTDFGYRVYSAGEIEFYLHGSTAPQADMIACYYDIRHGAGYAGIAIHSIEAERGHEQHEIALAPCDNPVQTAADLAALKQLITDIAATHNLKADFAAKPSADQPGSGLHIHLHLCDECGHNIFYKDDEHLSDALKYAIGGLLAWLPDSMAVFAPTPESYARFTTGSNAPTTISWGANNRTVAIRLPDSAHHLKRIEHRVAGADSNPASVMAVLLAAMHYGLTHSCEPGPQIYGDAALPMYELQPLASDYETALASFNHSANIREYFPNTGLLGAL
jgi:glutamine synthetase